MKIEDALCVFHNFVMVNYFIIEREIVWTTKSEDKETICDGIGGSERNYPWLPLFFIVILLK